MAKTRWSHPHPEIVTLKDKDELKWLHARRLLKQSLQTLRLSSRGRKWSSSRVQFKYMFIMPVGAMVPVVGDELSVDQ